MWEQFGANERVNSRTNSWVKFRIGCKINLTLSLQPLREPVRQSHDFKVSHHSGQPPQNLIGWLGLLQQAF